MVGGGRAVRLRQNNGAGRIWGSSPWCGGRKGRSGDSCRGRLGHDDVRPRAITPEEREDGARLLAVKSTSDRLKGRLNSSATIVVRWDERFDQLPECRPGVSRSLENGWGDSLEPVLTEFEGFAAVGGSPSFSSSAHGEGLD